MIHRHDFGSPASTASQWRRACQSSWVIDRNTRTFGWGPQLMGDVRADMEVIRAFYADKVGIRPPGEDICSRVAAR